MAWRIVVPAEKLEALRTDAAFHDLIMLARVINALRVALATGVTPGTVESVVAARQRTGAYFFTSGVLAEASALVARMKEHYSHFQTFRNLDALVTSEESVTLRASLLKPLRDKAVFHNDRQVAADGLGKLHLDAYIFAQGDTSAFGDVHFPLADHVAFAFAVGSTIEREDFMPAFTTALQSTVRLAIEFCSKGDAFMGEALSALGLVMTRDDP
jgi:hypothetical protein